MNQHQSSVLKAMIHKGHAGKAACIMGLWTIPPIVGAIAGAIAFAAKALN